MNVDINKFLNFNKVCPVCDEPLTLYTQVIDGPLWKAIKVGNVYHFQQFKSKNSDMNDEDFFWVTDGDTLTSNVGFDIDFSTSRIYQNSKTWTFFFFFMCNQDGIEDAPRDSYGINPCTACYYRSSPFLEFHEKEEGHWRLQLARGVDSIEGAVRDEVFSFRVNQSDGGEKMYVLDMDYETGNTILRYYSVTEAQRTDKDHEPNIFKMELPLLNVRPNFDLTRRGKLIDRFDSWILMS